MNTRIIILILFLSSYHLLFNQCIIDCNPNIGIFSSNDASTIAYDNMGTAFHSTFVREPTGTRVWGEAMNNNGTTNLLSPIQINSANYSALTGTIYHVGVGSGSIYNVQLIVLTSTGLFASGTPGAVLSTSIKSSSTFQKLTINGKTDGLPSGVSPSNVKMMFVSYGTIMITTCNGLVYVLSQYSNVRGSLGSGSATAWSQVVKSSGAPLTNIIATRGNGPFAFALKSDSTLWTWGDDIYLGNGSAKTNSNYAQQMTLPSGMPAVKMIQASYLYNSSLSSYYILGTDKKVYALGGNTYGELGDNTTTNRLVWVNCLDPNNSVIDSAVWISSNEHDVLYSNLAIIKTNYKVNLCGINQTYMIGRATNNGTNYLNFPNGISSSDTILYCEVGGHTSAFIKINTIRYGYVGHHVNGSIGNGNSSNSAITSVDFYTPPIINVCGTRCDTPILTKNIYNCTTNKAIFYIRGRAGNKVLFKLNNGALDSLFIGSNDSATITINNPNANQSIQILAYSNSFNTCRLSLNIVDTVFPKKYSSFSQSICSNQSYTWNGVARNTTGAYLDTFSTTLGCDSVVTLNLTVNPAKSSSFNQSICSNQSYTWNGVARSATGAYLDTFATSLGCDSVVTLNLTVNPTASSSFSQTICSNQSYTWNGIVRNTTGVYLDTFATSFGCDSFVTLNLTVNPTASSSFSQTICSNQSYTWNGAARNTTGAYLDTFSTTFGCDSVVSLNLTVNPTASSSFSQTICSNQSYTCNGAARNTTGAYLDTFATSLGCDSVVTLNLTVNPAKSSSFNQSICSNQSYTWNGLARNATGAYLDTFSTTLGCDSVVALNLTVNPTASASFSQTICSNQSYTWNGIARNTTGAYLDTFATSLGCDSVVTLNLTVNPAKSSSFNQSICSNQSYTWNGIARNATGAYLDTLATSFGCDSVVTLNLTVNPTASASFSQTICSNQSYTWNGVARNTTGAYPDTFSTVFGCDSVVTLNLTVNPAKSSSFNQSICSNQSYTWNGVARNTTGAYPDTFSTVFGCDSVVTLNLTVNPAKTTSLNQTICSNQSYTWNGIARNATGAYLDTFSTTLGCDSVVTLNLTVNPTASASFSQTICSNQSYTWNGVARNTTGAYPDTFSTVFGCDSVVTLNLTVNPAKTTSLNQSICSNQSYTWNGIARNATGAYLDTFATSLGCDSIVTLNLTVNPTKTNSLNQSICSNQSYTWNGIARNATGAYLDTLATSFGCDSVVTLNLTVNPTASASFSQTICSNQSYTWNGIARNATGAYLDTFSTTLGCDSVVTLNLNVNPTASASFSQTICSNQSYTWNGIARNATGAYLDTFSTTLGCDSVVTLNLTVNPTKSSSFNQSICSNQSYTWNGIARNATGAYLDTFSTTLGCDSVVTLNLNVNPTASASFSQTICSNQSYTWNGIARNATGGYLDTFSTTLGCDSVVTLNLTVNPTASASFSQTICSNQSYTWNGIARNATGAYLDTFSTTLGCDSVVTLNLTVNPTKTTNITTAICMGQSYFFNGTYRNTNGTFLDTLSTSFGCDSFISMSLTVHPLPTVNAGLDKSRVHCVGDSVRIGTMAISGIIYRWIPAISLTDSSAAQPYAKPESNTSYVLEIMDTNTGCKNLDTVQVVVTQTNLKADAGPDTFMCQSTGSISIGGIPTASDGVSPYTYFWSGNSLNNIASSNPLKSLNISGNFEHIVTVIDAQGCISQDTMNVSIRAKPILTISVSADSICYGDSSQIDLKMVTSSPIVTIYWNPFGHDTSFQVSPESSMYYRVLVTDSNQCTNQDSFLIAVMGSSRLEANAGRDSTICSGQNILLGGNPTAIGGDGNYMYFWSNSLNNVANPMLTNSFTNNYIVTVISSICMDIDTVHILVSGLPQVQVNSSAPQICVGDSVKIFSSIISGNGPFTYLWNTSRTDSSFTARPNASMNFLLTITDVNNCTSTQSKMIIVNPLPTTNAGPDKQRINCDGDSIQIGQNAIANEVYIWTPNYFLESTAKSNPWAKPRAATSYFLKVTNSITGCIRLDTVFVNLIDSKLTGTKTVRNLSCFNDFSGEITITASNGYPPYRYKTSNTNFQSNNVINGLGAVIDSYAISDIKGCLFRDSFLLREPLDIRIDSVSKKNLRCFQEAEGEIRVKVNGGIRPYMYLWDKSMSVDSFAENLTAGNHRISVRDANNCQKTKIFTLTEPSQITIVDSIIRNRCFGDSNAKIIVKASNASPPYSYKWSTGSAKNYIENLKQGKYSLTIVDKNLCIDIFGYSLDDYLPLYLYTNVVNFNCDENKKGELSLSAEGGLKPYFYSIDSGKNYSVSNQYYSMDAGKYFVYAMDKNGCQSSDTVRIYANAFLEFDVNPKDTTIELGERVELSYRITKGDSSWIQSKLWMPNTGLNCATCERPIASPYLSEIYTLRIYYNDNCIRTQQAKINVISKDEFYIPNAFAPDVNNPENSQIKIYGKNILKGKLIIFNRWGEKLFESNSAHLKGWDGIYKGEIQTIDVYSFYAEVTFLNGRMKTAKGSIVLIR